MDFETVYETKLIECMVCDDPVEVAADIPDDEPVLCKVHYFDQDMSEEWEKDEDEE